MNWKAVLVVLALAALAWSRPALAEKVKTNQSAKLYSRAGEQAPVILKLKPGQPMTVLAKDGRWVKVRVAGRTGWVPRTKLDMPEEDEIARNTRRRPFVDGRSTKRGFGGESGPDDRIGADAIGEGDDDGAGKPKKASRASSSDDDDDGGSAAKSKKSRASDDDDVATSDDGDGGDGGGDKEPTRPMAHVAKATPIYNDPDSSSDASFTAQPRTALYVVEEKGKWTFVENDEGDAGYVLTSKLELEQQASGPHRRVIDANARLGFTVVRQSLSTPGGAATPPDNYTASSSSIAVSIGGSALWPYKKRFMLGGELDYELDIAAPGIQYMQKTTGFMYHHLDLLAVGGYDLQKSNGMMIFARLGLRYDSFQVSNVSDFTNNPAKLPNQIIAAPLLGAALTLPKLSPSLGLKLTLDTVLIGASVSQTKNLEDGTNPSAKAVFLGGVLVYHWKPKFDLQFTADIDYTSLSFGGPPPATSQRGHMGTSTPSGTDFNLAATFGIGYTM